MIAKPSVGKGLSLAVFASHHLRHHQPVTHQGVAGVAKCGGDILFNEEVAEPRARVAHEGERQHLLAWSTQQGFGRDAQTNQAASGVDHSGFSQVMLADIEGIKVRETVELVLLLRSRDVHSWRLGRSAECC